MRTLAFDGRMGASGDMLLATLCDLGADPAVLDVVEDHLDVRYEIREVVKNGIAATSVDVVLDDGGESTRPENHSDSDGDGDGHDADREHTHSSGHDHHGDDHGHVHAEGHGPHRSYTEVVEAVEAMDLGTGIGDEAVAIFTLLGEAEASVHGGSLERIHFHEVGADDAIADVIGTLLLLDDLEVDRVVTTPLSVGGGSVSMSHGVYPVPGPATVEIAERADWSLRGGPIERELLTPTGAAILAHLADGVEHLPSLRVERSGYGSGTLDLPEHANVLRGIVGEERSLVREEITVLETNLDDTTPEVLGGLQETLAEIGARDVSILPATMKKSRPGHLVKVIARSEDAERVARRLAEETGTLGVRTTPGTHRWIARRQIESVTIKVDDERYEVDVKVASDDSGTVYDVSAEYDDAAAIARETGLPIREILRRVETAYR
ncbi:nickel pincer cofactor biosynthesis protein LarC [Natronorarus salvus]|uniref:nickel pincer cofactor biosynthesis protein LarC n=1 Tax=Natronorarus salvus TaxID=3117733 RepID=UPI002F26C059